MISPSEPAANCPVTIVIPAYGAAEQLRLCLESLSVHMPAGCDVIVADDATPDDTIRPVVESLLNRLPALRYARRTSNVGFVENCNLAVEAVVDSGRDVLLLNSDTEVTQGAIEEMYAVLHLHEKHAAVTPRTNNATIFTVPLKESPDDARGSFSLWQKLHSLLPRYQVMPTAVGFCMLVKNSIIREFGLFDPLYSPGYNEENDFICRINRCGYSAVAANHAFVFHHESSSFGARKKELDRRNREHLDNRYPEYARKVAFHMQHYVDPVDHFAVAWSGRRKRVLYDLSHLPAKHSGTSEVGLNLLLHLAPMLEQHCDLSLSISAEAAQFFASEITGYDLFDHERASGTVFDLVFKPCQVFRWDDLYRMVRLGARIAYVHLDIIAVRCDYLSGPNLRELFRLSAEMADAVYTISGFSRSDFEAFYGAPSKLEVVHLGTDALPEPQSGNDGYVLVVGNQFAHKAVDRAVEALKGVAEIVALGGEPNPNGKSSGSVRKLPSGSLQRWEIANVFERAAVVVYPSFYEGFGLPVLDALAMGRPVVALHNDVNCELRTLTQSPRLHLVPDLAGLRGAVEQLLNEPANKHLGEPVRSWRDAAEDYARHITALLASEIDVQRLRSRWKTINTLQAFHPF